MTGRQIHVTGLVQGVGFRPFVYRLARAMQLHGWVRNTSSGVDICVEGRETELQHFVDRLVHDAPALAQIDTMVAETCASNGFSTFEILHSEPQTGAFLPVLPDVAVCEDCLHEMRDPSDRRHRYPFTNCTNCGPRFTIISDVPYDRPATTMAAFAMCPACRAEYEDPQNRRFHAQPIACPDCGPRAWLEVGGREIAAGTSWEAIRQAQEHLSAGKSLAIKGLGGFHLACDALNAEAVAELRRRKLRRDKPFALMLPGLEEVGRHAVVDAAGSALMLSPARPVVLLPRRPGSAVAVETAPGQHTLGVMLPYTPLHALLFEDCGLRALVMTSGNLAEEPIATGNQEARGRLGGLADAFLMHDREILMRCDDSVVRPLPPGLQRSSRGYAQTISLRRSRGAAPAPLHLPLTSPPLLASGAELKNTFCLARDHYAFVSQHIGDLENYETLQSFEQGITHFERLFRIRPEALACDLHPDYLATRYATARAEKEDLPLFFVQHHHAHIAACMAENGVSPGEQVIGAAFDGTGFGADGGIWGGEFLVSGYAQYERAAHLAYLPLPGGDHAVRSPWRTALGALHHLGLPWEPNLPPLQGRPVMELEVLHSQLDHKLNSPLTSSMGRLFDAAASLSGVRQSVNYEAQAAIEFEALADLSEADAYPFILHGQIVDPAVMFDALLADVRRGAGLPAISARFHRGVAGMVRDVCLELSAQTGIRTVALSGGVWQNTTLLQMAVPLLERAGFTVLLHRLLPANDGGISFGQAVVASWQILER